MIRLGAFGLGIAAVLAASGGASAQTYPTQTVRIVVPFSAGSITDGLARILADKLSTMWKQQVIVENRPGLPGTASVATAAKDGHTLMLTSNGHTIARAINKTVPFDPVKDFAGVSIVASAPVAAIVPRGFARQDAQGVHRACAARTRASSISLRPASPARPSSPPRSCGRKPRSTWSTCRIKGAPEAVTAVVRGDVQFLFRSDPLRPVARRRRQGEGARGQFRQARAAASGCADRRGSGVAELSK